MPEGNCQSIMNDWSMRLPIKLELTYNNSIGSGFPISTLNI